MVVLGGGGGGGGGRMAVLGGMGVAVLGRGEGGGWMAGGWLCWVGGAG